MHKIIFTLFVMKKKDGTIWYSATIEERTRQKYFCRLIISEPDPKDKGAVKCPGLTPGVSIELNL